MRTAHPIATLIVCLWACPTLTSPATAAPSAAALSRTGSVRSEDLVGAWRLLRIEYSGPKGSVTDPYYGAHSTGMLIYDRSGVMSVHIVGQPRPTMDVPETRPTSPTDASRDAQRNAAVLDTYMSYFGTWDFDSATAVVTHHIAASLIPGESGVSYTQAITLDGPQLVFTNRHETGGIVTVRKKFWERVPLGSKVAATPR
jgi:Lipocalin-like domain